MSSIQIPDAADLAAWRSEAAPTADGTWSIAAYRHGPGRVALVPPLVSALSTDDRPADGWRFALWEAEADEDIRGTAPASLLQLPLMEVIALLPAGLRPWARAGHRQAIRESRAAADRARRAGEDDAVRRAERLVAGLEEQEAQVIRRQRVLNGTR